MAKFSTPCVSGFSSPTSLISVCSGVASPPSSTLPTSTCERLGSPIVHCQIVGSTPVLKLNFLPAFVFYDYQRVIGPRVLSSCSSTEPVKCEVCTFEVLFCF